MREIWIESESRQGGRARAGGKAPRLRGRAPVAVLPPPTTTGGGGGGARASIEIRGGLSAVWCGISRGLARRAAGPGLGKRRPAAPVGVVG